MTEMSTRILLVEDNAGHAADVIGHLERAPGSLFDTEHVASMDEAVANLEKNEYDIILLNLSLPECQGLDTLEQIKPHCKDVAIIVISSQDDEELALHAVRKGAQDYLVKGQADSAMLVRTIRYATERAKAEAKLRLSDVRFRSLYENEVAGVFQTSPDGRFLSANPAMVKMLGYDSEEELLQIDIAKDVYADSNERSSWMRAIDVDDAVHNVELALRRKDGSKVVVLENSRLVRDADNEPLYYEGTLIDVTERNEMEESLRLSEKRLRMLYDSTPVMMHSISANGEIISVNKYWLDTMGYSEDEVLGKQSIEFLTEDSRKHATESSIPSLRELGKHQDISYQMVRKDGRIIDVLLSATSEGDPRSNEFQAHARIIDVTDRKRAEDALRKSEERFDLAVRGSSDGIWDWDLINKELYMSPRLKALMGYRDNELESSFESFEGLVHPEDLPRMQNRLREHVKEDVPFSAEMRMKHKKGSYRWFHCRGAAVRDNEGRALRVAGSISDVTDRKTAMEVMRANKDFYELILDSVPTRIAYVNSNQIITYVNRAYEEWFKVPLAEIFGKRIRDIVEPEDYKIIKPRVDRVLNGETVQYQVQVERDDKHYELDCCYMPHLDKNGVTQGFFSVLQDMTDHKQLEAKLRQAQKMEAVGQLTGGVAHDFNNILSVIIGNLQLLERPLSDNEMLQKQLQAGIRAAKRGADLTRRLLAFSRKQVLEPKLLSLNDLVSSLDDLLKRSLGQSVDIATVFAGDLKMTKVDPGQLENAVLNLAINARDAMPDGGKLTIETCNVEFDDAFAAQHPEIRQGSYVMLAVSDTGTGMPTHIAQQAFEPFFTTKEVGKGSGLGLSMVYGFVDQSGGHARIYSEEGEGTSIKLYFPVCTDDSDAATARTGQLAQIPGGCECILVVEDDPDVREIAVTVLEQLGYRVLQAQDGPSALAVIENHRTVDLLFTDVMMPGGIKGPVLAQQAREKLPDLKVLFTSGFAESAVMHRGSVVSQHQIISKPYNNDELATKVRVILDEKKAASG